MDKYLQAISNIIHEQEMVIGPTIALVQARKVPNLQIQTADNIVIQGDPKKALSDLVIQYSQLFGQASVEVCKEAVRRVEISQEELPEILK